MLRITTASWMLWTDLCKPSIHYKVLYLSKIQDPRPESISLLWQVMCRVLSYWNFQIWPPILSWSSWRCNATCVGMSLTNSLSQMNPLLLGLHGPASTANQLCFKLQSWRRRISDIQMGLSDFLSKEISMMRRTNSSRSKGRCMLQEWSIETTEQGGPEDVHHGAVEWSNR